MLSARRVATLLAAPLLALATACSEGGSTPQPAAQTSASDLLLGRWEVVRAELPPTVIVFTRDGSGTAAQVSLSGIRYDGRAVSEGGSVVIYHENRATIRGTLLPGNDQLRVDHLDEHGGSRLTQLLARSR